MKTIKGSTNPKAEEKTFYELSDFVYHFENPLFGKKENEKHIWTLYKQVNNKWKQVSGNIKYGEKVPYTFGEKAVGISFKIEVHTESKNILNKIEKKLTASLVVVPRTKHEPVIGRVILLNRNNADVNKATFNESLSAEARTSNLVGKEITFYLWEEGTTEDKKYQKPKIAKVDKNGIAKIKFSLSEYAAPQTWMSFFSGNNNVTKKFFVTASYQLKEVTNRTPVSVTEGQQQQKPQKQQPQQQTEKKDKSAGFIEKATNIIAEGVGKIGDYVEEKTRTATSVGGNSTKQTGTCICQEQYKDLIWGGKVSCEFRKKVFEIAKRLGKDPNLLMAGMALETGRTFSPSSGKGTSYVGLIQFGDSAAESVGTTRAKLLKMTAVEQLDYVEKYLTKKKDKINTLTDFYLSILMPVDVGKGNQPNHVVFDNTYPLSYNKSGKLTDLSKSRHFGYRQNPSFFFEGILHKSIKIKTNNGFKTFTELYDEKKIWYENREKKYDGEGKTHIWEIEKSISKFYEEGKKYKTNHFECTKSETPNIKPSLDKGVWNVVITEKYTGSQCTHKEKTPFRNNCRRGKIEVYDHTEKTVLIISDCLLEGIAGEDRMVTDSDAPFGVYQIASSPFIMGSSSGKKRTAYGPNPRLSFEPIPGNKDEAAKSGRSLIRIHGGRQETELFEPRKNPYLMRTHGCIRILDQDAKKFYDWWVEYHKNNPNIKPGKLTLKK